MKIIKNLLNLNMKHTNLSKGLQDECSAAQTRVSEGDVCECECECVSVLCLSVSQWDEMFPEMEAW